MATQHAASLTYMRVIVLCCSQGKCLHGFTQDSQMAGSPCRNRRRFPRRDTATWQCARWMAVAVLVLPDKRGAFAP